MCYSSGIFPAAYSTLREASIEKMDRICRKLELHSGDHLLEIGTGWGGFALYAAQQYGCRVTTTTISREQYELTRERVEEAGLANESPCCIRTTAICTAISTNLCPSK